ncbi:hypothetical protein ACFL17_02955 [Pseudomonadota bacterium]
MAEFSYQGQLNKYHAAQPRVDELTIQQQIRNWGLNKKQRK